MLGDNFFRLPLFEMRLTDESDTADCQGEEEEEDWCGVDLTISFPHDDDDDTSVTGQ